MRKSACGVISSADTLLYLYGDRENARYTVAEYLQFADRLRRAYLPVLPFFGMNGLTLCIGLNRYLRKYHPGERVRWGVFPGRFWLRVEGMLERDIPVIMSIGPHFPRFWKKAALCLYRRQPDGSFAAVSRACAHYVTVTGMDAQWLRISSWGKEYYINREEYIRYIRENSSFLVSNIVYFCGK